jgi:hypothetical protein
VTAGYSPTMIQLNVAPPLGTSIPLGIFQLPNICITTDQAPAQLIEIKWMQGDSVVCRDTIRLDCEPPCGYILDEKITCDPATGGWVYQGTIKNTSAFTMGEAHIVFTSPAGLNAYNQTISLGGGLPPGGTQPFSIPIGAPATAGDSVCFTVALHELDDDAQHTNCCNFHDCIVLPPCAITLGCACEDFATEILDAGLSFATPPATSFYTGVFNPMGAQPCDVVYWYWPGASMVEQTIGNQHISHTFPGLGKYTVCAYVFRTDANGNQCSVEACRTVKFTLPQDEGTILILPNPSGGEFTVQTQAPWQAPVQLRLLDLQSRLVKQWDIGNAAGETSLPIRLDALEKGVYLLEIESEGVRRVRKVVIQ